MDGISPTTMSAGLALIAFGGWSLAAYFGRLIYTGKVVPRTTYEDQVNLTNQWMAESRIKDQQIQVKDDHARELTEQNTILLHGIGPAITAYMDALQHAGKKTAEEEKA